MPQFVRKLSPKEVIQQTGLSKSTVYEMLDSGKIPNYKVGRRILVDPADLEEFLQSCKRGRKPTAAA